MNCNCDLCKNYGGEYELYYGIATLNGSPNGPRNQYVQHLNEKWAGRKGFIKTLDDYNNASWYNNGPRNAIPNHHWLQLFKAVNQIHANDFQIHNLVNQFYSILEMHNLFGKKFVNIEMDPNKKLRRACKFGILFANKIHFVLDGFDPSLISKEVAFAQKDCIPYTTSELRFIYRHWNTLKNKVNFYFEKIKLNGPPWELCPQFKLAFSQYEYNRSNKMEVERDFHQLKDIFTLQKEWWAPSSMAFG